MLFFFGGGGDAGGCGCHCESRLICIIRMHALKTQDNDTRHYLTLV